MFRPKLRVVWCRSSGMVKVKALAVWTDWKQPRGSDSDAVDCSNTPADAWANA